VDDPNPTTPESPITQPDASADKLPERISRYVVKRILGRGGFGVVYLADDPEKLQRLVAIKVPHPELIKRPEDAEPYLSEARTVAGLDHPNIVTVFDVGETPEFPFFIVSKYIEGSDLKQRLTESRPSVLEAVELIATVAETLHFAHRRGLVHRDIKPGNILLDNSGKPYVADFGLALKEENVGKGPRFAGTPMYMSPEQARGEGHRVDGRSDIFSLGVVFYELLTGRRPFHATNRDELLEQITTQEPRPPRQWEDTLPKELERICLKALSKRAADRYSTAKDMADDLRGFFEQSTEEEMSVLRSGGPVFQTGRPDWKSGPQQATTPHPSPLLTPGSDSAPLRIVPKGLRSFDAQDADFFLELLPGPRDRGGLPDSIRFWKTRIEETDPDNTFAVGLIYGPSGCGKSSLVKAGLLPRLSGDVITIYIEATADETETRLLNGLRKRCPALPANIKLRDTLAALRHGDGIPNGKKVLIVLDQFEQWLHARNEDDYSELVQALRQCEGGRVQCIVMVRDDFWMAATRFMRELEIRLLEGQNSAAVDLFDLDHARKVLSAFGRAFGKLPANAGEMDNDQKEFLKQAVSGLAQEGKIVSVRLALFAEMMKGKAWTPASLRAVGGTEGVGVTFLEETFSSPTAPPQHRYHQKAARADLKMLLPETGSDIKGHMRSYAELLEASGYGDRPKDFDDLIRILDNEIRLITPTDPEGKESESDSVLQTKPGQKYYQLTHDYLVHSIREWLTRKQKETRRGRAELLLADRAAVWNARPENRQLPSLFEWLRIKGWTSNKHWTSPQRKMMRKASRYHVQRGVGVVACLGLLWFLLAIGLAEAYGRVKAHTLRERLLEATISDVPGIIQEMPRYRSWLDPLLHEAYSRAEQENDPRRKLHARLALLPVDASQADYLIGELMTAKGPDEVKAIRTLLHEHAPDSIAQMWPILQEDHQPRPVRLRAAAALALSEGADPRWNKVAEDIVRCLANESILLLRDWAELLEPVRGLLVPHAARRFAEADAGDYATFLAILRAYRREVGGELRLILKHELPATAKQKDREELLRQKAQAAIALIHLEFPEIWVDLPRPVRMPPEVVWPLFQQTEDPTLRTYLIHRCAALGVDPEFLARVFRFYQEAHPSLRQGLLLAMGEYNADQRAELARDGFIAELFTTYIDDPDPGVHSAAEWLLRRWGMSNRLPNVDRVHHNSKPNIVRGKIDKPRWYVNGQGQILAVIPAPGKFTIGSPRDEPGRFGNDEDQREVQIDYAFAVATKLVTVAEFKKCLPDFQYYKQYSPGEDTPINSVSWYDAARYCNWLSEQEKIPMDQWCYEPNAKSEYDDGMKVKANYWKLSGYRLPREVEWEYACRAGTITEWSHGSEETMLGNYAWYSKNSGSTMHPVGWMKPNGLGLFDTHGNAWELTQSLYKEIHNPERGMMRDDKEDKTEIHNKVGCVLRGGSYVDQIQGVRSANHMVSSTNRRSQNVGFRPARTITP
jgi:serine/threonine protein kinase/formylglycine-generating enzyme required for sulfatase activity